MFNSKELDEINDIGIKLYDLCLYKDDAWFYKCAALDNLEPMKNRLHAGLTNELASRKKLELNVRPEQVPNRLLNS